MPRIKRSEGGFIAAYIGLYAALSFFLYFYFQLKGLPPFSWKTLAIAWGLGTAFIVVSVIPARWSSPLLYKVHTVLAWISLTGIAFGFYFILISVLFDILLVILPISFPFPFWELFLAALIALLLTYYGYKESMKIRSINIEFPTKKLPEGIERFRILQISDLHLGMLINKKMLQQIMQQIQEENPDVIVSTGDLLDGEIEDIETISEMMLHFNPPYGKFAVTGNHEFYAGIEHALDFTGRAGFEVLRGAIVPVGPISIAGVDDPGGHFILGQTEIDESELLQEADTSRFTLLLKHRPLVHRDAVGKFDLQLSGHVHHGQLFPFMVFTWLFYKHTVGMLDLGKGSWLYVSRGTGTWGPPVRILAFPELTIIDLVSDKKMVDRTGIEPVTP